MVNAAALLNRLQAFQCLYDPLSELEDLLRLFASTSAGAFLEIGTHKGFTSAAVALAFPQARVVTIDLPDSLRTAWNPLPRAEVGAAHRAVGVAGRIEQRFLDSAQLWQLSAMGECYDLVFVDGDHGAEAVFRDLMLSADLLRDGRSLLVAHDYTAPGEAHRPPWTLGVQQGVDRFLAARPFVARRHAGLLLSLQREGMEGSEDTPGIMSAGAGPQPPA